MSILRVKINGSWIDIPTISGASAYQIAVKNGFEGTEEEWLESLQAITPTIGENGNWYIDGEDSGMIASPELGGYYNEDNIPIMSDDDILEICK